MLKALIIILGLLATPFAHAAEGDGSAAPVCRFSWETEVIPDLKEAGYVWKELDGKWKSNVIAVTTLMSEGQSPKEIAHLYMASDGTIAAFHFVDEHGCWRGQLTANSPEKAAAILNGQDPRDGHSVIEEATP